MCGIDTLITLKNCPEARIMILSTFECDTEIQRAMEAARDLT